jgi:hypothetical protein
MATSTKGVLAIFFDGTDNDGMPLHYSLLLALSPATAAKFLRYTTYLIDNLMN